jgi:hypothetical protein
MAADTVVGTVETAYPADSAVQIFSVALKTGAWSGDVACRMVAAAIGNHPTGGMFTGTGVYVGCFVIGCGAGKQRQYQEGSKYVPQ